MNHSCSAPKGCRAFLRDEENYPHTYSMPRSHSSTREWKGLSLAFWLLAFGKCITPPKKLGRKQFNQRKLGWQELNEVIFPNTHNFLFGFEKIVCTTQRPPMAVRTRNPSQMVDVNGSHGEGWMRSYLSMTRRKCPGIQRDREAQLMQRGSIASHNTLRSVFTLDHGTGRCPRFLEGNPTSRLFQQMSLYFELIYRLVLIR
jgi:hypothetical protein